MTLDLEDIASNLLLDRVPDRWLSVAYPSFKPLGGFLQNLIRRI